MLVTISFKEMPGDKQVESITVRLKTDDYSLAVAQAIEFLHSITTVEIREVNVKL